MFHLFKKDSLFLVKYHLLSSAILFILNCTILYFLPVSWGEMLAYAPAIWLATTTDLKKVIAATVYAWSVSVFYHGFGLAEAGLMALAVLLTFPFTGLLHCASHGSIRPKWLNRPLGELMGWIQLSGFPDWHVLHVFHHQYTDHPDLDPHPPLKRGFFEFAFSMRAIASQCFVQHYMRLFKSEKDLMKKIKMHSRASRLTMLMKLGFWYFLLGPQIFSFLFLSSILFKMFHYAWLNYSTHRPAEEPQSYVVKNLNTGLYPLINFLSFGLYFHANHHSHPNFFNPQSSSLNKLDSAA